VSIVKVGDELFFSPKFKFKDLDWENSDQLIAAFENRVVGWYLLPASRFRDNNDGFACGVICVTAIDFLARVQSGDDNTVNRIVNWLSSEIPEFGQTCPHCGSSFAYLFYSNFRNGLVHEGRIKKLGQFTFDNIPGVVVVNDGVMLVNVVLLLSNINRAFSRYISLLKINKGALSQFILNLKKDFGEEVARAKTLE
jgi:hypothetical protein